MCVVQRHMTLEKKQQTIKHTTTWKTTPQMLQVREARYKKVLISLFWEALIGIRYKITFQNKGLFYILICMVATWITCFTFLSFIFISCISVCIYAMYSYVFHACMPCIFQRQEEDAGVSGTGVWGNCEVPDLGTENYTRVFWRNSKFLKHLISPLCFTFKI